VEIKYMMNKPVVLITGASSGIGEKTALTLGKNGYRVFLAARRKDQLDEIVARICEAGGEAISVQLDLSQVEQITNTVNMIREEFGVINILVNNAGSARHLWLDELSLEKDIQFHIQVNLTGMIQLTRAVLPEMLAAGSGHIIHVSSAASWVGIPTYTIYNACKFGSRGFLESLRRELRGTGITVSEVFPGAVDTGFAQDPDLAWRTTTVTPKFALLSPEVVADEILRLIHNKKTKSVIPRFMLAAIWANAHFPGFVGWVLSKFFYYKNGKRYSWRETRD
jgi:short-subunit dehydrogenase